MWMYGHRKMAATPASTSSTTSKVAGSSGSSHAVWSAGAGGRSNSMRFRPVFNSGRIRTKADTCPGVSTSGTMVTKRVTNWIDGLCEHDWHPGRRTPKGDAELMAKEQVLGFKPANAEAVSYERRFKFLRGHFGIWP